MRNMRGIDITVIGIVAFLGIAAMVGWIIYQGSVGTERARGIIGSTQTGKAFTKLENVKRIMTQNLVFSAHQASLRVAAQGGSYTSQRYWMCGENSAPTENEVLFALSNASSGIMHAYVNNTQGMGNVSVSGYDCVAVHDPGGEKCSSKSSLECETFLASASTGRIDITEPERLSYEGSLQNDLGSNRFFWLYHRLKKVFDANRFKGWVIADVREHCTEPTTDAEKISAAIDYACEQLQNQFDQYVNVTCKKICIEGDMTCLNNMPCEIPELKQDLCYESKQSLKSPEKTETPEKLSLQAATGSFGINIEIKDEKYGIPGVEGELEPMVWNLKAVTSVPQIEHRPIDKTNL